LLFKHICLFSSTEIFVNCFQIFTAISRPISEPKFEPNFVSFSSWKKLFGLVSLFQVNLFVLEM